MRIVKTLVLATCMLLPCAVSGQQTKMLTADKHNEYGLVYTLPRTALEIEVTAKRTVRTAGPYYQYAKRFIGTDKVIKEDSESWTITDVKVRPYGVSDDSERYLMQLKAGALTSICVDDNGMLLAINREVSPERKGNPSVATESGSIDNVNINEYLQYVDEDFIASQSSAKRAQMLAENLMEIREAKISLTRGTAESMPQDGKQLEIMLNSLSHQEAALTAAFIGISESETVTETYTYTPSGDGREVLFRLSDFSGFVGADDYSGDPVYITVKTTRKGELPKDAKGEEKKLPKDAVIYNIPGAAAISITSQGKTLYDKEIELAQLGVKFGLAPTLFSAKKNRSYAEFNPITGGLIVIAEDGGE
ncbi:MAG: DUF4831 family protein [Muribaculaceae bacterium]|nr:DUF4831 family protein [Muribaculaceae bacterium]